MKLSRVKPQIQFKTFTAAEVKTVPLGEWWLMTNIDMTNYGTAGNLWIYPNLNNNTRYAMLIFQRYIGSGLTQAIYPTAPVTTIQITNPADGTGVISSDTGMDIRLGQIRIPLIPGWRVQSDDITGVITVVCYDPLDLIKIL